MSPKPKPRCKGVTPRGTPCKQPCTRDPRGKRQFGKPVPWLRYCIWHAKSKMNLTVPTRAEKLAKTRASRNKGATVDDGPEPSFLFSRVECLKLAREMTSDELY